jgi:rRNA-processing protein FCF1
MGCPNGGAVCIRKAGKPLFNNRGMIAMHSSSHSTPQQFPYDVVVVDTSALMEHTAGFEALFLTLKAEKAVMIIPTAVEREIHKHLRSDNAEKRAKAERADDLCQKSVECGVGKIIDLSNGMNLKNTHADQEIVGYVEFRRKEHDFLVLTGDRDLATSLLRGNKSRHSKTSRRLRVATFDGRGHRDYWEEATCTGAKCGDVTAIRASASLRYPKPLCGKCIEALRQRKEAAQAEEVGMNWWESQEKRAEAGRHGNDEADPNTSWTSPDGSEQERRADTNSQSGQAEHEEPADTQGRTWLGAAITTAKVTAAVVGGVGMVLLSVAARDWKPITNYLNWISRQKKA